MRVPAPRGQAEAIMFIPLHLLDVGLSDHGYAATLNRVIQHGTRVPMKSCFLPWVQQITGHREKCMTTFEVPDNFYFAVAAIQWGNALADDRRDFKIDRRLTSFAAWW